ncbi:hypothetical protein [Georgenia faecalis]|uniref:Uncharacterized protein n=1 Tax=Georgenia faecalis TaxID=2483799 RepID=A0ABV9D8V4_9MICO|nr:hypothetical protein [Georgenia faecalis]
MADEHEGVPRPSRRDLRDAAPLPDGAAAHPEGRAPAPAWLWLLLGATLISVSLAVLWGASRATPAAEPATPTAATGAVLAGSEPTPPTGPPTAVDLPTATAPPTATVAETAAARMALEGLPSTSDCSTLFADAQVVHAYGATVLDGGHWPDMPSARLLQRAVEAVGRSCGPAYADRLVDYVVGDPTTASAVVYTLQEHAGALPEVRPAPAGALTLPAFQAAGGTIRCTLTPDGVGCTIAARAFENPPGCTGPTTGPFSVALFAAEVLPCAGTIAGGTTPLAAGQSSTVGHYACTAEAVAVRCWHTVSGVEFSLAPGHYSATS